MAIEQGGRALIRVEDDGEGMSPDDARLAVHRHATSKIRVAADLDGIRTLGFRGEALPSIASVSHFALRTRARGALTGIELRIDGGELRRRPRHRRARRHDDRGPRSLLQPAGATEVPEGRIGGGRAGVAADDTAGVGRADCRLPALEWRTASCSTARRPATSRSASTRSIRRVRTWWKCVARAAGMRIHGYIAPLAEQGPRRGPQNIYVNGRIVRDKTIATRSRRPTPWPP